MGELWLPLGLMLGLPALLLYAAPRVHLVTWLSPAFFCYALGIVAGNVLPVDRAAIRPLMEGSVVLAIPLLLFSSRLRQWLRLAPSTALSYLLWLLALLGSVSLAVHLFGQQVPEAAKLGGMAASVYSGGTANMAAVHLALGVDGQVFGVMNMTDLLLSGSYLLVVLTVAGRFFRWWLRPYPSAKSGPQAQAAEALPLHRFGRWAQLRLLGLSLLAALGAAGLSAALTWLLAGSLSGPLAEILFIVLLTLLGLSASAWPGLRRLPGTFETGEFLFLAFCVAVGALVDLRQLVGSTLWLMGFMATCAYGGVLLHLLLCRLFRIDSDTALITNVAGIFGPPFIGPVAEALHNRELIISGLTLAAVNLALGNFFGLLLHAFWQ